MSTHRPARSADARNADSVKADRRARPRVVDILRAHGPEFARRAGDRLPLHVRSALAQLTACGTAALGSHAWFCASCGETRVAYNACRQRHCPSCGGAKRAKWFEQVADRILPVTHFHLVFTLPHELSRLILANRRALYGLLFRAAWDTLRDVALDSAVTNLNRNFGVGIFRERCRVGFGSRGICAVGG